MLQLYLVMFKNQPGGTGFEGIKGSWRTAEAWHYERLWKAIGESAASVVVDSSGLKSSCKELRLGTMKRAWEKILVKSCYFRRSQCIGHASTTGWSTTTAVGVEWINLNLRVLQRAELEK